MEACGPVAYPARNKPSPRTTRNPPGTRCRRLGFDRAPQRRRPRQQVWRLGSLRAPPGARRPYDTSRRRSTRPLPVNGRGRVPAFPAAQVRTRRDLPDRPTQRRRYRPESRRRCGKRWRWRWPARGWGCDTEPRLRATRGVVAAPISSSSAVDPVIAIGRAGIPQSARQQRSAACRV
jgi:hypothetical protein